MVQPEQLAVEFQQQFKKKYGYYPYSLKNVKDSKWWVHFERFAYNTKLEFGSEKIFINNLFLSWKENTVLWPFVLSQKFANNIEEESLSKQNNIVYSLNENNYICETFKKCIIWGKQNKIQENVLKCFLEDDMNQLLAERGNFYLPIFLFDKKFVKRHGISEEENLKKRSIRSFNKKLYLKLKESLKDEFIE